MSAVQKQAVGKKRKEKLRVEIQISDTRSYESSKGWLIRKGSPQLPDLTYLAISCIPCERLLRVRYEYCKSIHYTGYRSKYSSAVCI